MFVRLRFFQGNRQQHLVCDATNLLVLMERMDPEMQRVFGVTSERVIRSICKIQAWARGLAAKRHFRKNKDMVSQSGGLEENATHVCVCV